VAHSERVSTTTNARQGLKQPGVLAALGAAALFGAGAPAAKLLLDAANPWLLAGLLYLGSGLGLWAWRLTRDNDRIRLGSGEWVWLAGAILSGGVVAPALLMLGLRNMPASEASLLLNAEGVFTAVLAWFVFRENFDRRIALGMLLILLGALVLNWAGDATISRAWPALCVLAACFLWGLDNNLTRKVSLSDATWIASIKGLSAGVTNLVLAMAAGAALPSTGHALGAMTVGFFAYGVSLVLFIVGLRHLGTARTGAYFSVAPFFGAALSILALGEPLTPPLLGAGVLMALGVWLHLTERHEHEHAHGFEDHEHEHTHDDGHHHHEHADVVEPGKPLNEHPVSGRWSAALLSLLRQAAHDGAVHFDLASAGAVWAAARDLSQQQFDCERHTELCQALSDRFGIRVTIDDPDNDHTFRVVTRS